ncbi:DUF3717 domain-containing protein, partial [Vibrio cholerae O1]|nr:DUF3717 domain-containing protein [Vibrio cholerae O1]
MECCSSARPRTGMRLIIAVPSPCPSMTALHITDIEAAINYSRERNPPPDGVLLQPKVRALAEVYALMIF